LIKSVTLVETSLVSAVREIVMAVRNNPSLLRLCSTLTVFPPFIALEIFRTKA